MTMHVLFVAASAASLIPLLWFGEFNGFTIFCLVIMSVAIIGVVQKEGWR
jgi:hypothetical protein